MIRIYKSLRIGFCVILAGVIFLSAAFAPVSLSKAASSSLPKISGATFTKYEIDASKVSRVWSLGNLVCTWDGKNTRYYGPAGTLIKTFTGDASSVYSILEDTYVRENDGEEKYSDTYVNGTKYDAAKDGLSDFVWVENCIINIRTGKVLDKYTFEGIYGVSLAVATTDFIDGVAPIRVGGRYGVMTDAGKIIVEPKYESCFVISGGYSILENSEGKWAYADKNGTMSEFKFTELMDGGLSGVLIGSIEKTYLYDTSKAQEVLNLHEKVLINHGKEYSLCLNLPNCSVDLGNYSNGYAHAIIKYYYVSPTSFELKTYTAFDGYFDQYGNKKIDFTDHSSEDTAIMNEVADRFGVDISTISMPVSIDLQTKPEVNNSTYYKYGMMLADSKLASASMLETSNLSENMPDTSNLTENEPAENDVSIDYAAGYALYDKSGKKLMTFYSADYNKVEVIDTDLLAAQTTEGIFKLISKTGAAKLSVSNCSRYEVERSETGHAIVRIFQRLDSSSSRETTGLYYEETGYYTGQYDGYPSKVASGNDDYIFKMHDIDGYMVVSKKKIIVSKTECAYIRPTLNGYVVINNTAKNNQYKLTFYTASGAKQNTVTSGPYYISSVPYGATADRYTDSSIILDGKYYDGLGNRIGESIFFNEPNYINHGFALVGYQDSSKNAYGILSAAGKMVTGYIFTSKNSMYGMQSEKIPNKYGSLLVCYQNRIYRFHSTR